MWKQNTEKPYGHKTSAVVCYKSVWHWQRALNQQPYGILSTEKKQQESTHTALHSLHTPVCFFKRDYFQSEDSLIPCLLLRLSMAEQLQRQFLRHIIELISYGWNPLQISEKWLLQETKAPSSTADFGKRLNRGKGHNAVPTPPLRKSKQRE